MYIVAIGWMFVVVCMAAAEAASSSILGALGTLMFYGVLPLGLVLWLMGTPQRRRNRARHAAMDAAQEADATSEDRSRPGPPSGP